MAGLGLIPSSIIMKYSCLAAAILSNVSSRSVLRLNSFGFSSATREQEDQYFDQYLQ